MQAGRELDAKVAEALGWQWGDTGQGLEGLFPPEGDIRYNTSLYGPLRFDKDGYLETMPRYSTSWEGMGVLVEEARKKGIFIKIEPIEDGYKAKIAALGANWSGVSESAPHAVSLLFVKVSQISI